MITLQGVAERGVSVVATKNIIDAVKVFFFTSTALMFFFACFTSLAGVQFDLF